MPEDEQAKVDRYLQPDARRKGLLVRGYLRGVLSFFARLWGSNIAPNEWQFRYLEKGKPVLSAVSFAASPLVFNLSHSGDYLLIALTRVDPALTGNGLKLGVDIERLRPSTNIYSILDNYFTAQEREALLALPEDEQRQRFFDLWALKESFIKATGLGLAQPLKSFHFVFDNSEANVEGKERLALQHNERLALHKSRAEDEPASEPLVIQRDITLRKHQGDEDNWQVLLGKLNSQYRFALSLNASVRPALSASVVRIDEVLQLLKGE
ncbi:4'-phosphopantetheinyl transferase superfamily protein [Shewanella sp. AS1]|nr:4'-phosphopantetheinyl transferase superfamily protein [Shewanella sp. AS1]MCE9678141.1 4'-phosphopantetheinyl transferase superfamily protein [Shewanella sp. AS1]